MLDLVDRFGLELDDLNEVGSAKPAVAFAGGRRYTQDDRLLTGEVRGGARRLLRRGRDARRTGLDPADLGGRAPSSTPPRPAT